MISDDRPKTVIVSSRRSPIGRAHKGSLAEMRPDDMLTQVLGAVLSDVPELDPNNIEDIIVGCGLPGGRQGYNIARVAAVLLGQDNVPGTTVTRYCASSVQSLRMAHHAIQAGEGNVFLAAGVESLSSLRVGSPDGFPDTKNPIFDGAQNPHHSDDGAARIPWTDPRTRGELPDIYISMGQTAENVADVFGIGRREQDAYALRSQTRVGEGLVSNFYDAEITPLTLPDGTNVISDDSPRPNSTESGLGALEPVFRAGGTVTAGNACPLNDGAAAMLVMSDRRARELGFKPLAEVVATSVSALSPEIMGLGPVEAIRKLTSASGIPLDHVDHIDINEAFAVQVLACVQELNIDVDRVNTRGGAIALGHPFGMTGARMVTSMLNTMRVEGGDLGVVSMCTAGGQGMAVLLRNLQEKAA